MIKFSAINDKPIKQAVAHDNHPNNLSTTDNLIRSQVEVFSKEREEFRIMNLYKEALELQMKSQYSELIDNIEEILTSSIMKENVYRLNHIRLELMIY